MDDGGAMRRVERRCNLHGAVSASSTESAPLREPVRKRLTIHEFHDQVRHRPVAVDARYVPMS